MRFLALILSVLLLIFALPVYAEGGRTEIGVDCEDIVYMGRWEKREDGLMHGSFECGLVLRFTGTGIYLNGDASGVALIAVDGGEPDNKDLNKNAALFSDLPEGEHTLELYAAAQQCFPVIGGFSLDNGASTLPSPEGKFIEFIGDSITEGYVSPNDAKNGYSNSYKNSYAFLTGRKLMQTYGMRFNTIAYGGICIVERGDNPDGNDPLGMPERYFLDREYKTWLTADKERAQTHKWDTSVYTPDIIVINLGTNDNNNSNQHVKSELISFLQNLRGTYNDALILVMTPFIGVKRVPIQQSVVMMNDEKIVLVSTKDWNIKAGSDWLHPSPEEHVRASEYLLEVLRPYIEEQKEQETEPEEQRTDTADGVTATEPLITAEPETDDVTVLETDGKEKSSPLPYIICGAAAAAAAVITAVVIIIKKKK